MKVVNTTFILLYSREIHYHHSVGLTLMNQQEKNLMDEKYLTKVWEFANKFVGKTIHAENDFDGRQFAKEVFIK